MCLVFFYKLKAINQFLTNYMNKNIGMEKATYEENLN